MATPPNHDAPPPAPSPFVEYAYMYEKDKSPTKQLDALLRAIGRHILLEIGDKDVVQLTPEKLAAFYKAVGGDYDSLFVDMPHASISYVWQVTGCQHTLQPTDDDFAPPTIPALTPRGFSRWESLEILLGPDEHVPFLEFAVKNWALKHPETGQAFPPELPKEMFPSEPDIDVDRWHKSCAEKLRKEAASKAAPSEQAEPKFSYVHVPRSAPFQGPRQRPVDPPYTERPVSYVHVSGRHAGARSARHSPDKYHPGTQSDDHSRRRSFSDYSIPPNHEPSPYTGGGAYLNPQPKSQPNLHPKRPVPPRRHSQPRHLSSDSSDEELPPPRPKRQSPPPLRRFPPTAGSQPPSMGPNAPSFRAHRPEVRPDEPRRRPAPSPSLREKLTEKVANILPNGIGPDRPRNHSRQESYGADTSRGARRSREQFPPSRLSRSYSDLDSEASSDPETSDEEFRRRKMREDRDRDRDRERYRDRGRANDFDREREDERRDRQPYLRRPEVERRTSSHADADRRRDHPTWDPRSRDQVREDRKRHEQQGAESRSSLQTATDGIPSFRRTMCASQPRPNSAARILHDNPLPLPQIRTLSASRGLSTGTAGEVSIKHLTNRLSLAKLQLQRGEARCVGSSTVWLSPAKRRAH
ncbi:hypothetical protein G7046_g2389 [Stylonectria norvegica]|nr:hypothetical protein G7046_g2389 [Stylonectria norvegica]